MVQEQDHAGRKPRLCPARGGARSAGSPPRRPSGRASRHERHLGLHRHPHPRAARLSRGRAALGRASGRRRRRRGARRRRRRPVARARREIAERFGARYVAHGRPLWPQRGAQHAAWRESTGELVVFVDDDVRVRPGWLDALLRAAEARPAVRRVHRPDHPHARGPGAPHLRPRGRADHRAGSRARATSTPATPGARTWPSAARRSSAWARSTPAWRAPATSRSGRTACAAAGGPAPALRRRARRSSTGAAAATPACADSPAPHGPAAARRAALTPGGARRRRAARELRDAGRLRGPRRALPLPGGAGDGRPQRRAASGEARPRAPRGRAPTRARRRGDAALATAASARDDFLSGSSGTVGGRDALRRAALDRLLDARELLSGRRARARARRRRAPAARRVLVLAVVRPEHERRFAAIERRAAALAPRGDVHTTGPAARASSRTSTSCSPRTRPASTTGCSSSTTTSSCRPASSTASCSWPSASGSTSPSPPTASPRTPPGRSPAAARGSAVRETAFVEIGPVTAFAAAHVRGAAAVPAAAHGLGAGRALGGARPRAWAGAAGSSTRSPIGHRAAPAADAYSREAAIARGARLPGRAPVSRRGRGRAHPRAPIGAGEGPVKVAVVSEFYPRRRDPVLGIWAHRQALAARAAGAEVEVLVLHRVVPAAGQPARRAAARRRPPRPRWPASRGTTRSTGCRSPTCRSSPRCARAATPSWGAWAAPPLRLALRRLRRRFPFDLVHAHNAVPGRRRGAPRPAAGVPLVVSVHGGDVLYTARTSQAGDAAVRRGLGAARLVLANSDGHRRAGAAPRGRARRAWCTSAPTCPSAPRRAHGRADDWSPSPTWSRASAMPTCCAPSRCCRRRHPTLRYQIIGDGPERAPLRGAGRATADRRPRELPRASSTRRPRWRPRAARRCS